MSAPLTPLELTLARKFLANLLVRQQLAEAKEWARLQRSAQWHVGCLLWKVGAQHPRRRSKDLRR